MNSRHEESANGLDLGEAARVSALIAESDRLRQQLHEMTCERDFFKHLYAEQVRGEYQRHPEWAEKEEARMMAEMEEARKNPGDIMGLIHELEGKTGKPVA